MGCAGRRRAFRFTLLSTVGISHDGRSLPIQSGKVRTLLALLLIASRQRVTVDYLVEHIWVGNPPRSAVKNVQLYVHRLRQLLEAAAPGACGRLRTTPDGYCLEAESDEVDVAVAESLAARAWHECARGDLRAATGSLSQALSDWSEQPVTGVSPSPVLIASADRLRDRRLDLFEEKCAIDLQLRDFTGVADRLRPLVAMYPLRESLHALLMRSLWRGGRRADAIEVFHALRRRLADELAILPDPAVTHVYRQIIDERTNSPGPSA